jgi:hypothetical protein
MSEGAENAMKRRNLILPALLVLVLMAAVTAPLLAQSGNSWYVQYYSDPNWSVPSVGMNSSYIEFNWGTVPPAPGMPPTNWTATMTSTAYFYAGNYTFSALADDEISMQIDGVTYINTVRAGMSGKTDAHPADGAGESQHRRAFSADTGAAYVYLTWIYGASSVTPAPPPVSTPGCDPWWSCTCPAKPTSLTTRYGDYTSCIQQNIHQSNCFVSDGQWDSPNMGSIQSEPPIQVWGACTPGQLQCMQLACNQAPVQATCSKTAAGWFYYGPCPESTPTP